MGGHGSGRKPDLVKQILDRERRTPIASQGGEGLYLPNHSGIASHPEFKKNVGSGTLTTIKEATIQVGDSDIVSLNFGTGFDVTEPTDKNIDIQLDLGEFTLDTSIASGEWVVFVGAGSVNQLITLSNFETSLNHDNLTGFVTNEHIDWTGASAGTIHASNYVDNDTIATHTGSISVEDPTNAEDITIMFTSKAITISEMRAVLLGSATPSVTWTIRHHATDRSNAGNEVVTSGTTTTSTTSGSDVTSFNDATIPADSFIWLETTAKSGTVTELHVTYVFTED